MSLFPSDETLVVGGKTIAYPGMGANGKFVDAKADPTKPASFIPAETINRILDLLETIITDAGNVANNTDVDLVSKALATNKWSKKMAKEFAHEVGDIIAQNDYVAPSPWNPADPDSYRPRICLSDIVSYRDVTQAVYPKAVTYLRARKLIWRPGIDNTSQFQVTAWARTSNVVTLTFANTTAITAVLQALSLDNAIHGSYSNWRSVSPVSAIGTVALGDYAITNINSAARQVSFASVGTNGSGTGTWYVEFYPHRIAGSATTARLFEISARGLISGNDSTGRYVPMLRSFDQLQGFVMNISAGQGTHNHAQNPHSHDLNMQKIANAGLTGTGYNPGTEDPGVLTPRMTSKTTTATNIASTLPSMVADSIADDGTHGAPRIGSTTDIRALAVIFYMHAGDMN